MRITAIETIHVAAYGNVTFVEVHTDEGFVGLGETFRTPQAVAAHIHETIAPYLLGKDPRTVEAHSRALLDAYVGFASTSVEVRAASAIDIALWDVWGQSLGQPIHALLGGLCRDRIRVYNTCAGYAYNARGARRVVSAADDGGAAGPGPYDDQVAFVKRPAELAQSLLDMGITAMKIWPFDAFAVKTGGRGIAPEDLRAGLDPFRRIRDAVGDRMDIMCEFHSLWDLPTAVRIADALAEYGIFWSEDPIKMVSAEVLADYRRRVRVPVCGSETLATRYAFRNLLVANAVDYVMVDVGWCGGLTEARKIAAMAEAWQRPVAPHDCVGPVVLVAALHLSLSASNALFQEVVRAAYTSWYRDLVTELPRVENGEAYAMTGPGLGTALVPGLKERADVRVERSSLGD
jgi:L-alanine-DL-glutamate epimerase-like enolase superfamily enzyme